jgi:predicted negative regulator of RcsB-dependent stress response
MKQDEFVSWMTHATLWIEENTRTVLMGLGAGAVLLIAVLGIFAWRHSQTEKAFTELGEVQRAARAPVAGDQGAGAGAFATAQQKDSRVIEAADRMLHDYPGGPAADWARYHRAAALLDLGKKDEAAAALAPVLASGDGILILDLARLLSGRIEEARGDLQSAADAYAAAAAKAGKNFPPELALSDQARCLAALGKKQEAINAYQKILDDHPETPLAGEINQKLQELRGQSQGI